MFVTISRLASTQLAQDLAGTVRPVRLAYRVFGERHEMSASNCPLIIMHGLLGSKKNWYSLSRTLAAKLKRRVYTLDARNHGDSAHSISHSAATMSIDVLDFLRQHGIDKACIMGNCMGGRTAMHLALKYPEVIEKGIIVDTSSINLPRDKKHLTDLLTAMKSVALSPKLTLGQGRKIAAERIRPAVESQEAVEFILLNLKKRPDGVFYWSINIDALQKNLDHYLNFATEIVSWPKYDHPMSFICGKYANFFEPDDWPMVRKIFPNSEIHWLNTGNAMHYNRPKRFVDLITKFLKN